MNNPADPLTKTSDILSRAQSGVICINEKASQDTIAAATALYIALTKQGKNVSIVSSNPVESDLVAADKIQTNFTTTGDNLVISLPYQDGALDRIDYTISGDKLNLVIKPKEGFQKIEPDQIKYSYAGGDVDFIITVDASSLKSLGDIYHQNQKHFEGKTIINIGRQLTNTFFGTVNLVSKTSSSTSEIIFSILKSLRWDVDRDTASNLYQGLSAATNGFTSFSVTAETFEAAARLLRGGAVKKAGSRPQSTQPQSAQPAPQPTFNNSRPHGIEKQSVKTIDAIESEAQPEEGGAASIPTPIEESEEKSETPEDWLKPKIFRSGGNIS